ncbi:hybrid sensor histidine kinase/response regulator [Ruegeria sp.]|uniref:sensor histidine kinase n=1 Tax=Ruegeria sp. TaxID=1879320 RepID=UPI0023093EDD|nr:hybrid sensor histidine kinase/response regulator [Ruegeria sp.]MDA7966133.1 hybrid sensor histidine kinase/response regulator [Ruegeria sp.]
MAREHVFKTPEERYKAADFKSVLPSGDLEFHLKTPLEGSNEVHVRIGLVSDIELAKKGKEVFLIRKSSAGNWQALICSPRDNPWTNGLFLKEGVVNPLLKRGNLLISGRVQSFITDAIAIMDATVGGETVEVQLRLESLPFVEPGEGIRDVLVENDLVEGYGQVPDVENLRLPVDVKTWQKTRRPSWELQPSQQGEIETSLASADQGSYDLEGKCFLLIDDDRIIVEALRDNLEMYGARVLLAHGQADRPLLDEAFDGLVEAPDFILLDKQLEGNEDSEAVIVAAIKAFREDNPLTQVLLMTGDLNWGQNFAAENGFGYMAKPFLVNQVLEWAAHPEPAEKVEFEFAQRQAEELFAVDAKTKETIEKTNAVLQEISERSYGVYGGLWFIETSSGRFELRASSDNLGDRIPKEVETNLARSVVGRALTNGYGQSGVLPENDPFQELKSTHIDFPRRSHYCAFPLNFEDRPNRVIVFFSSQSFPSGFLDDLETRRSHFELLISTIEHAEELDEIATSASLGRLALGCMHEMRNKLTQMFILAEDEAYTPERRLKMITNKHFLELRTMAVSRLLEFNPKREHVLNLDMLLSDVCAEMRSYFRTRYVPLGIPIDLNTRGIENTVLSLDPTPLERTIINLMENSAEFMKRAQQRRIGVTAYRARWDTERPIRIRVADNGTGISILDQARLFKPRSSTLKSTEGGVGLGLFISRSLVRSMGGELTYVPGPRWGGAIFEISLPEKVG